ncbi:MAG: TonB-dependent receptor [Rickettsiales bacterium]|nr:TonB-dependent receptor [Rickettsiales bacterium]
MKHWLTTSTLVGLGVAMQMSPAYAAKEIDQDALLNLSLEELTNIEVTSVSKKAEKASEAAAAIYVITQDDIHRSGLTNIPELLRMVPGLHVAQSGSHQWSVSSRGMSGQFADTLLVLIDGRTVYTPLYSGVYWDIQDTPLQDIERIEVIRGPGATLWGANAVNGVINIITKSSKDTQGGYASTTVGNYLNAEASTRYGAKIDDNSYVRAYAKYNDYAEAKTMADRGADDNWNKAQAGFRTDLHTTDNRSFTLQGDMYDAGTNGILNLLQPAGNTVPNFVRESDNGGNILGRWNEKFAKDSELTVQMYYDLAMRENIVFDHNIQTLDLDAQHAWSAIDRHEIVWGMGYRRVITDVDSNPRTALGIPYFSMSPNNQEQNLYSAFFQDKIALVKDQFFLTLGSKFEHNDFTGIEYQPSARLSWIVDDSQTLWSSISRSVRTPNIGGTSNVQQLAVALAPDTFYTQVGNPNQDSIEMVAYELGYRIQPAKNLSFDLSTFYNDYDNMIIGVQGTPYFVGPYTMVPISPESLGRAHTWGFEAASKWNPVNWAELSASYTLLHMKFEQPDPLGYNFRDRSPEHQFNVRSTFFLPHNVEFTTSAYYVDQLQAIDINTTSDVSDYLRFDTRLAWKPMDSLELSLVGQNLLDGEHQEYYGFAYQNSSQVPRSVYGNITWKF